MITELVTSPTTYPVTLGEARSHLRVTHTDDDSYISDLIVTATEFIEDRTSNRFASQTWRYYLHAFPNVTYIKLPFGKVISVSSIKYTDYLNTETTWSSTKYTVDTVSSPGKVDLIYNGTWPDDTLRPVNAVVIEYVTGYSDIPYKIKQAILLYISHLYENREPIIVNQGGLATILNVPMAINSLIADYRMGIFR